MTTSVRIEVAAAFSRIALEKIRSVEGLQKPNTHRVEKGVPGEGTRLSRLPREAVVYVRRVFYRGQ